MNYKQDLMNEHRAIERMLAIVDAMRIRMVKGEQVPVKDLDDALEFIRGFADQCHHHKEEALLFPAMEEAGVQREGGQIGSLLTEHEAGRAYVGQMSRFAASSEGDVLMPDDDAMRVMLCYTSLLHEHIRREDEETFPLADRVLSEETKQRLAEEFDAFEREVMGEGRHEYFHQMIERMEQAYGITALV